MTIILPSGYRIILENLTTYSPGSATTVVFTFAQGVGTGDWTETFLTAETAASFLLQLDAVISQGKSGIESLTGSPTTLISVSPNPFDMHVDYILVEGNRFEPGTIGNLYFNDVGTAPDFLGYKMALTYISPTQLRGDWISDGSAPNVLNEQIAYYKDANNLVSNILGGVYLSGIISLTFTSISPNASAGGVNVFATITGTGFFGVAINALKAEDGLGNNNVVSMVNTIDDATMTGDFGTFVTTGVFTVYYSTDGGTTWTTTALTITIS